MAGTGTGAGKQPIWTTPQVRTVAGIMSQGNQGDLDFPSGGDGKWNINWSFVACPGGSPNTASNTGQASSLLLALHGGLSVLWVNASMTRSNSHASSCTSGGQHLSLSARLRCLLVALTADLNCAAGWPERLWREPQPELGARFSGVPQDAVSTPQQLAPHGMACSTAN